MESKPYASEHSARIKDPDLFMDGDGNWGDKNIAPGIRIILGRLKSSGEWETQAYRFKAKKFTAAEAKAWLKKHDIKYILFEPAKESDNERITIMNKRNFDVKSNFELKDVDEKQGIVTGYCSMFGNVDSDNEMVMPGAFQKTLEERGCGSRRPRIKHLWQHSSWDPIAIPQILEEQDKGLYFESVFGKDSFSQDKLQQHVDRIITELSIGYNTIKSEDVNDDEGKLQYRKLTELKLWEYSSVTWGANSLTHIISAKGETEDILINLNNRLESLNRALKNNKYTEETCEQFEAEIQKIQTIIKSLDITMEPDKKSTPEIIKPTKKQILEIILQTLKNY